MRFTDVILKKGGGERGFLTASNTVTQHIHMHTAVTATATGCITAKLCSKFHSTYPRPLLANLI